MIVRGITQLPRRTSDLDNPDLVWMLSARHGADNSRWAHSVRESAKTTARSLVRGSPMCEAPEGFWPGTETLGRPAALRNVAEPQAEPSDVLSNRVAELDAKLVPRASRDEFAQPA